MLLELRQTHWRIDRDRNGASIEDGEKRDEEIAARRQHQGDPVTGYDIPLDQALRGVTRLLGERTVGQGCKRRGFILQYS